MLYKKFFRVINKEKYYQEQLDSMRDMMDRTTSYMEDLQQELKEAKISLEERHVQIVDSINYASKIQKQLLPDESIFENYFADHYWFISQRDTIGGDFIFVKEIEGVVYFGLFDCTGRGIPGALLSIMGHQLINEIFENKHDLTTSEVADSLNQMFTSFFANESKLNDGMEGVICRYDPSKHLFSYTSAGRPVWMKRNGEWLKLFNSRSSIGALLKNNAYHSEDFSLVANDEIFIFSDGLPDQFGGPRDKKFLPQRIMSALNNEKYVQLSDRLANLETVHKMWYTDTDQTDDISFVGVKF